MFSAHDWQDDANRLIRELPAATRKVIQYYHEIEATDSRVYQEAMNLYYAHHVCRNKVRAKRHKEFKNPNGNQVYQHMWGASEFSSTGTLKNYDRTVILPRVDVPSLFVCGQHDEARLSTARRYVRAMSDASLVVILEASHFILAEKPAQLVKLIRQFLNQAER